MPEPRVDLHEHFFPAAAFGAESPGRYERVTGWRFPAENFPWSPEKNLALMDRLGIGTATLSLTGSPGAGTVWAPPSASSLARSTRRPTEPSSTIPVASASSPRADPRRHRGRIGGARVRARRARCRRCEPHLVVR